jgi:hypothetical protein
MSVCVWLLCPRCAQVEMEARNNATMLESVLAGIDAQIADLERLILEKERWEIREEKREDTLAEEGRAGQGS